MTDTTTTPLVERLRAQAARHRENATGLASAALLEEAAEALESAETAISVRYTLGSVSELVKLAHERGAADARAAERARCAMIADDYDQSPGDRHMITDEMIDMVHSIACCCEPVGVGDGCGTMVVRMPTRSSIRAALEAYEAARWRPSRRPRHLPRDRGGHRP